MSRQQLLNTPVQRWEWERWKKLAREVLIAAPVLRVDAEEMRIYATAPYSERREQCGGRSGGLSNPTFRDATRLLTDEHYQNLTKWLRCVECLEGKLERDETKALNFYRTKKSGAEKEVQRIMRELVVRLAAMAQVVGCELL